MRLDGGFAHPAVLEFLDAQTEPGICGGDGQKRGAEADRRPQELVALGSCPAAAEKPNISTEKFTTRLANGARRRRVVIKAEVVRAPEKDPKDNPRFVITNMKQSPQWIYERVYCQRGDVENRIKELHDLEIDRGLGFMR